MHAQQRDKSCETSHARMSCLLPMVAYHSQEPLPTPQKIKLLKQPTPTLKTQRMMALPSASWKTSATTQNPTKNSEVHRKIFPTLETQRLMALSSASWKTSARQQ